MNKATHKVMLFLVDRLSADWVFPNIFSIHSYLLPVFSILFSNPENKSERKKRSLPPTDFRFLPPADRKQTFFYAWPHLRPGCLGLSRCPMDSAESSQLSVYRVPPKTHIPPETGIRIGTRHARLPRICGFPRFLKYFRSFL